ncbi:MAG: class I SAM-dependent methyltransferase [Candidatus Competibacteraceae bacterium]|nr:class I SAM-dependent methyltransferase [Candidatus Competibacteraceae bacterium]
MHTNELVENWPESGLESVKQCPVCGSEQRTLLYDGLTDRVFRTAPGHWTLYQCTSCGSAYLDPRPNQATVGLAYGSYYTHDGQDHPTIRRIGRLRTMLHDWLNGYMNVCYGLKRQPASALGRWMIPLLPPLQAAADTECRHLPRPLVGGGALLDVGCGNGGFLMLAQEMGWSAEGIDLDSKAVATARQRGLVVRQGGIEILSDEQEKYDVITLSHVIEHVHDPLDLLRNIYRLLKPGGSLWLETPNLASLGHKRFGENWRDLDAPRHLVLFTPDSLRQALKQVGFEIINQYWRGMVLYGIFAASEAITKKEDVSKASRGGRPPLSDILWKEKKCCFQLNVNF